MAINTQTFETLTPFSYITFTFPNPNPNSPISSDLLRVAVLDSPTTTNQPPKIAAMIVPNLREHDWIFSTEQGHLHLLHSSPGISRLVLIGNNVESLIDSEFDPVIYNRPIYDGGDMVRAAKLETSLIPLLIALSPRSYIDDNGKAFGVPFLSYSDNVKSSVVLEKSVGISVGEMLVEDIELECVDEHGSLQNQEFRRRLVFRRMPNLIQTEIRIVPRVRDLKFNLIGIGKVEFAPDLSVLVDPYLASMVAALAIIGAHIDKRVESGFKPKALCIGVGGGALLGFLRTQLGFEVFGVEEDREVVRVAKKYFGLNTDQSMHIGIGDGIEMIKKRSDEGIEWNPNPSSAGEASLGGRFDVIMVDLDSRDIRNGAIAPPLNFTRKRILTNAKWMLGANGILVVNLILPGKLRYEKWLRKFNNIFAEVYEIDAGNEENYVFIALAYPIATSAGDSENPFMRNLELALSARRINSIRKI